MLVLAAVTMEMTVTAGALAWGRDIDDGFDTAINPTATLTEVTTATVLMDERGTKTQMDIQSRG